MFLRTIRVGLSTVFGSSNRPVVVRFRPLSQIIPANGGERIDQDELIQRARSASNVSDVFEVLRHTKANQVSLLMQSMRSLFEIQKMGLTTSADIINHPGFEELCRRLRMKSGRLEFNEIVDVIKILSVLGVPYNTEMYHVFLNLVKQEINSATLPQIVFLDFVLQKPNAKKNSLVDALRISFPILFQMHISQQLDHENIPQLIDYLGFISRNRVNRKTSVVVLNALILHGSSFSAEDARKIVWSLCDDVNPCSEQREKLFNNVLDALSKNLTDLNVEILENTVSKMAQKYAKHPSMYHEKFLNEVATMLLEKNIDFTRITYFLKGFNRMAFVSPKLLHHVLLTIQRDPSLLETCRPTSILSLCSTLSNANFRSYLATFLPIFVQSLFQNPLFKRDLIEFPWTKLACDLASLDIFAGYMKEKLFSPEFLEQYLSRESTIDYLQFLKYYQSVMLLEDASSVPVQDLAPFIQRARSIVLGKIDFPLKTSLEFAFGGQEYVATKVLNKYNHLIDHILQFNENKDICKINLEPRSDGTLNLEDLQLLPSSKIVAVMGLPKTFFTSNLGTIKGSFDLQMRTIEATGVVVVPVDLELWYNLQDREKIAFLQREIKAKL